MSAMARAKQDRYSVRNATSGSTRVARTAGMMHATSADTPSTAPTTANTTGSLGATPNRAARAMRATPPPAPPRHQAERNAQYNLLRPLPAHHAHDIAARGTEGHPNSQLAHAT